MYGYAFFMGVAMDFSQFLQKKLQAAPETLPFSGFPGGLPKGKLMEISGALGGGKTEVLLRFLRENPSLQVAWIEVGPSHSSGTVPSIYPCALSGRGVDLSRVLFVEPSNLSEALWCAQQILKSQIFGAVILSRQETTPAMVIPHTTRLHFTMHAPLYPKIQIRPRDSRSTELRGPQTGVQASMKSRVAENHLGEIELRRLQIAAEKSGAMFFLLQEKPMLAGNWPLYLQLTVDQGKIQVIKHRGQALIAHTTHHYINGQDMSGQGPAINTTEGEWAAQNIG
jgi:hypothetical protein